MKETARDEAEDALRHNETKRAGVLALLDIADAIRGLADRVEEGLQGLVTATEDNTDTIKELSK